MPANADGFAARVSFEIQTPEGGADVLSGELMGRGGKLVFMPEASGARGKRLREARISFVWDHAEARGYMISDALQACAPLTPGVAFTAAASGSAPSQPAAAKVEGHPCEVQDVTVSGNDGSTTSLRVWRATDLKGLPVQVAISPDLARPVFRLTKIRPASPSPDALVVSDGFTKYRNVEAMMNELRMRQQGMKRRPSREGPDGEHGPPGAPPNNNPTRSY
jgi:hypothetical protein